jgi:hypothetical protein
MKRPIVLGAAALALLCLGALPTNAQSAKQMRSMMASQHHGSASHHKSRHAGASSMRSHRRIGGSGMAARAYLRQLQSYSE